MTSLVQHRLLGDPVRVRLLEVLAAADAPLGIEELAATVRRHPNSVREQLARLVDGGLVVRLAGPVGRRGRPPHRYRLATTGSLGPSPATVETEPRVAGSGPSTALDRSEGELRPGSAPTPSEAASRGGRSMTPAAPARPEDYRELARALADALLRLGGRATAEAAGEAWGEALAGPRARRTSGRRAVRRLVALLDRAGFAPEPTSRLDAPIRLRRCPFADLAREGREVVCAVHLGMLRGALRRMGASVEARELEPFVEPDLCLVHLAPTPRTALSEVGTDA